MAGNETFFPSGLEALIDELDRHPKTKGVLGFVVPIRKEEPERREVDQSFESWKRCGRGDLNYTRAYLAQGTWVPTLRVYRADMLRNRELPEDHDPALALFRLDLDLLPGNGIRVVQKVVGWQPEGTRPATPLYRQLAAFVGHRFKATNPHRTISQLALDPVLLRQLAFMLMRSRHSVVVGGWGQTAAKRCFRWIRLCALYAGPMFDRAIAKLVGRLCLALLAHRPIRAVRQNAATVYIFWRFPLLTETFIRREINAIRRLGWPIEILAQEQIDDSSKSLVQSSEEFTVVSKTGPSPAWKLRTSFRRPLSSICVHLGALTWQHGAYDTPPRRRQLLVDTWRLAYQLELMDVGHVHAPWANRTGLAAALAARLIGLPFSVQVRAYEWHRRSERSQSLTVFQLAQRVITNSDANALAIQETVPELGSHLVRIRNGLNLSDIVVREISHEPDEPLQLIAVGRLVQKKGFDTLLYAIKKVVSSGRSIKLKVIGSPHYDVDAMFPLTLHRLHRKLNLEGTVRFYGSLSELDTRALISDADVLVLPAQVGADGDRDVTPNVVLEAMAEGIPVIVGDVGATRELVIPGETGWILDCSDVEQLTDLLEKLCDDRRCLAKVGIAGRYRASTHFQIQRNARAYVDLFSEIQR